MHEQPLSSPRPTKVQVIYPIMCSFVVFAEARFDDKYIHIGAFDYSADADFRWVSTNTPLFMTPANWLPGNPRGNGRRCIALQTWEWDKFGEWADSFCWVNLPFVCEVMILPPF